MDQFFEDVWAQTQEYYDLLVALLPKLFLSVIVLIIALTVAGWVRTFARRQLQMRMDDPLLAQFFARMIRWTILIIGLLIILNIVGLSEAAGSLLAGAGITAFIIGFAFKDIGENFLAGILMAFKRPFRIGDTIETNGIVGKIVGLTLRDTQIKTFDGKDVYMPNGQIMKNPIINYTIDGFLRLDFAIGLDYESDIEQATEIIFNTLRRIPGILWEEKTPQVVIYELGSSTINLKIYFWIDTFDKNTSGLKVKTDAMREVVEALSEAEVYLPADIIELKIHNEKLLKAVSPQPTVTSDKPGSNEEHERRRTK